MAKKKKAAETAEVTEASESAALPATEDENGGMYGPLPEVDANPETGESGEKECAPVSVIRVTAPKRGRYRAGRHWTGTTDVDVSGLTDEQIRMLTNDPKLTVDFPG